LKRLQSLKNSDALIVEVKVKPNAKVEEVTEKGGLYEVKVATSPVEGKANERMIKLLAEYFSVPKSAINILRGETSRNKLIEIKGVKVSR